jgi:hypothetical protein
VFPVENLWQGFHSDFASIAWVVQQRYLQHQRVNIQTKFLKMLPVDRYLEFIQKTLMNLENLPQVKMLRIKYEQFTYQ